MDEWKEGRTAGTLESKLETFLSQNRDKAFTLAELANSMYTIKFDTPKDVMGSFVSYFNIGEALRVLIKEGKAQSRLIRGLNSEDVYYARWERT